MILKRRSWLITAVLVMALGFVYEPSESAIASATSIDTVVAPGNATARAIDTYLRELTSDGLFSGSALVADNGTILLSKGYGLADRLNRTPNTPRTRFALASITKQFTAMAILMLQNQGQLDVQDRICVYILHCPRTWRSITIHHLLTHTSGIPDYMAFDDFDTLQALPTTPAEIMARFKYMPLDFAPGTNWHYSNSGYIVLGYIIEQVSNMPYDEFLREKILDPLQMLDTGYGYGHQSIEDSAKAYEDNESVGVMDMSVAYAAGGLQSTVEDLYRWDQALYTNQLLPRSMRSLLFKPYVRIAGSGSDSYGYGWFIRTRDNRRVVEHTGSLAGFNTLITRFPKERVTIILLCNQQANLDTIGHQISTLVFSGS
jgi:CubicO group peptidase (beta-lactamase class C family)